KICFPLAEVRIVEDSLGNRDALGRALLPRVPADQLADGDLRRFHVSAVRVLQTEVADAVRRRQHCIPRKQDARAKPWPAVRPARSDSDRLPEITLRRLGAADDLRFLEL